MEKILDKKNQSDEEYNEIFYTKSMLEDDFLKPSVMLAKASKLRDTKTVVCLSSPYKNYKSNYNCNTITISASGVNAGYVWYHNYPIWASDCIVIISNGNNLKYIFHLLKNIQKKIYNLKRGQAQPHVYPNDIASIKIQLPSLEVQEKVVDKIEKIENEISVLENEIESLNKEKESVLNKYLYE